MLRSITRSAAVAAVASVAGIAGASPVIFEITGRVTDAENLTFAVFNGNLLSQNPQPGDLPLAFTGQFTFDGAANLATFQFEGSFTSPGRSYSFDISTPNVSAGISLLDLNGGVSIQDVFDGFDFELFIGASTGRGSFSFRDPGAVPTSPAQDVFAAGVIDTVRVIPTPGSAALLAAAGLAAGGSRRRA